MLHLYLNNVDIPTWVDGNTAYVGFTGATGLVSLSPLYINSFVYTVERVRPWP